MLAPLSPNEESTFRRIHFGTEGDLAPLHIQRLQQLKLIEWSEGNWRLTAMGHRRYDALVFPSSADQ